MALSLLTSIALKAQPIPNFNIDYVGYMQFGAELNDVWGYTDEQGNEYALVGRENGFSIIDVTDPSNMDNVFGAPGLTTVWRDIKTWGDYAYVTCECFNGLLIVDMSPLPEDDNLTYTYWVGDTATFYSAHNLYIDDQGYAYIFGANYGNGGAIILDLNQDPMDPTVVGVYDDHYLHDGVVRNDTLWGGAVYVGEAQTIDVSDKSNPQIITSWKTPSAFTHNMWYSDDARYLFTTDEVRNGKIAAYDISEPLNPTLVDTWMPNDTGIIPHNAHYKDEFLITSYYTIGLSILDVRRPNNLVEVGRYDTSPDYHYQGFHGCWGAYPWLPSGRILATDIEKGLYVLEADYQRACYLEGQVTDQHTGNVIFFPTIELVEDSQSVAGSIVGKYAMGTLNAGTYSVKVSAEGYFDKVIEGLNLTQGELTVLDVELSNWPLGVEEGPMAQQINVYPNPAREQITVTAHQPISEVEVIDISGRSYQIKAQTRGNQAVLNINGLQAGAYFLRVIGADGVATKRLMVE
jgi:choice-of-anchor B domain-containing protein